MWKIFRPLILQELKKQVFIEAKCPLQSQIRTTFILKRTHPPKLHRKGESPKNMKRRNFIYELVKDTNVEKAQEIEVILKSYVEGLGNVGDKVSVKPNYAYDKLLLPGLAVYATPENFEKYRTNSDSEKQYSSAYALYTVKSLQRVLLSVVMNMEQPWTIKPWHIKASFRKCGYVVPEYAITVPEQPISGPNMDLENKEFLVTVTINKTEKVQVRCRIHHWSTNIVDRVPYIDKFWNEDVPAILPEQASDLENLPKKKDLPKRASAQI